MHWCAGSRCFEASARCAGVQEARYRAGWGQAHVRLLAACRQALVQLSRAVALENAQRQHASMQADWVYSGFDQMCIIHIRHGPTLLQVLAMQL